MSVAALPTRAKIWKQGKCPSGEEGEESHGTFSPFTTAWRDPEIIMPREISQSEKDKYLMISLTCWNRESKINR